MIPVVAIVGRKNVGKSTLFNQLTRTQNALVADYAGLTRDRQYGYVYYQQSRFILIDTGGLGDEEENIDQLVTQQCEKAISEADLILFLVDAHEGLTASDEFIVQKLRRANKKIILIINKSDGVPVATVMTDFFQLGLDQPIAISATHARGLNTVLDRVMENCSFTTEIEEESQAQGIKVAIVGRPNVGKSTLINRLLGEERVVVCDQPGTTRDSVFIPFEREGQRYTLIDTAGIRRRGRITETVEKFSVIHALQSIEASHVVVFLLDAQETISDQDLRLLGLVLDSGRALVIAINKWDGLSEDQKAFIKKTLDRRINFLSYVRQHFISALHGTGVGLLFKSIHEAYDAAHKVLSTPMLTRLLQELTDKHQPPLVKNHKVVLRYAHSGGHHPPIIVIHGSRLDHLPQSYKRYLENNFRKTLKLVGTPLKLQFVSKTRTRS